MRSKTMIEIVGAHAEGEVGDVIIGGAPRPPGATVREMRDWIAEDDRLRRFVLNEPRGGVFRHVNLLVPPDDPRADAAFIIMEPADTPLMSGSNSICVSTVLLETGLVPMREPETVLTLQAPGGLVTARVQCREGRAERVEIENLPAFPDRLDAPLEVEGLGTLTVDTAWGGDSFVIVDAAALGFALTPDEARDLAETGARLTAAATDQLGFTHHGGDEWRHISFCQFAGPLSREGGALTGRNAVAIRPGKIDRSPTGTGCSARMAVLAARGLMRPGETYAAASIAGGRFDCRFEPAPTAGDRPAIRPFIAGRAWITGKRTEMLDPTDPFPEGYRLTDTWPAD